MGVACGTYGGGQMHTWFWCENMKERSYLEDVGVEGRIVLKLIL